MAGNPTGRVGRTKAIDCLTSRSLPRLGFQRSCGPFVAAAPITATPRTDRSSAIVTTTYRHKRPLRKKKPIVLTGSAIVRSGRKRADVSKPATHPAPANNVRKSAIVTITGKRGRKLPAELEDDPEADARVKAFLARMVRPGGPLPPRASE